MRASKAAKWALATAAITVYFTCPAYRYYVIGSWVFYKIVRDKPSKRYRIVSKGSQHYKRLVGGAS